jgi:hypothetical protein
MADAGECSSGQVSSAEVCRQACEASSTCPANQACLDLVYDEASLGYTACGSACTTVLGVTECQRPCPADASGACMPHCNPLNPHQSDSMHTACGPGETCQIAFVPQGETLCASPVGTLGQGSPCESIADCKPGYRCEHIRSPHVCLQYCRLGFTDCLVGSCYRFEAPAYDGTQELGLCGGPAPDGGGA